MIRIGCDLVNIDRFTQTIAHNQTALEKLFTPHELAYAQRTEQLAGIFAAKESAIKALGSPPRSWHDIEIGHQLSGRPTLTINTSQTISTADVSISHDGQYAMACVVLEIV